MNVEEYKQEKKIINIIESIEQKITMLKIQIFDINRTTNWSYHFTNMDKKEYRAMKKIEMLEDKIQTLKKTIKLYQDIYNL
jgi:hypothetical protein